MLSFGAAFGRLVRERRGKRGWSQASLGLVVFRDRITDDGDKLKQDVSKLERGKIANPHQRVVQAYCDALDIKPHEVEALKSQVEASDSDLVDALIERNSALAKELSGKDILVRALARKYATGNPGDFDGAIKGLARALKTATDMQQRAALPSNIGEAVDAVLKRMAELNEVGELDAAAAEVDRALAAADIAGAALEARKLALLNAGIEQDILRRNPGSAAARLVARLALEVAEPGVRFAALRDLRNEWYERGRDKGLNFDTEVAVALAQASVDLAEGADQRSTALNDLGVALGVIGEREAGTERLEDAVAAFSRAQKESPRERVPLDWAMTQMNLGNALKALGEREGGNKRMNNAVAAYRNALKEWTREKMPLQWATAQMNLGNALRTLGEREAGTGRLEQAVTAFRNALKEWPRKKVPLNWAMGQMNLGNALRNLGTREAGTERLEDAVTAYRNSLKEWARERVPLDWAMTQMNLGNALRNLGEREAGTGRLEDAVTAYGNALQERTRERVPLQWANVQFNLAPVELAFFDKTGDVARLDAAEAYARAALEVFEEAGASQYVQMAEQQLAQIAARRA